MAAVGGEHAVIPRGVHSGFSHQRGEFGDEVDGVVDEQQGEAE